MRQRKTTPRRQGPPSSAPNSSKRPERSADGNQGEGNREADRRYRESASDFARSGRVKAAGEEARRSVEDEDEYGGGEREDVSRDERKILERAKRS